MISHSGMGGQSFWNPPAGKAKPSGINVPV